MRSLVQADSVACSPESLVMRLRGEPGVVLLRSSLYEAAQARYSYVAARPFRTFRSFGSRCEVREEAAGWTAFGNPWPLLDRLMGRYELLDEWDVPFPLGGCFGYWGYDLKNFVEPRLPRRAADDLALPECCIGFYDSLVVFDHSLNKTWMVSTGLRPDGSRCATRAQEQMEFWAAALRGAASGGGVNRLSRGPERCSSGGEGPRTGEIASTFTREGFMRAVAEAQGYIRAGHIYQVNLAQRLSARCPGSAWGFFQRLAEVSPAPFAAYLDCGEFQVASSSPELFLRLSGASIQTRPIKGTRPRSGDPDRDAQLSYELQTSAKEMAELVMITDLLRNDLGRVCEYGSVRVPELARLERYAQVQHLVSTVEGRLRPGVTHLEALAACFPGGSITGAPKIRAMEIIDELEPTARGPYTGCLGYLGFNRESQFSIIIRTALCMGSAVHFHVGAGIVADSVPEAEYDETMAKAEGLLAALGRSGNRNAGMAGASQLLSGPGSASAAVSDPGGIR